MKDSLSRELTLDTYSRRRFCRTSSSKWTQATVFSVILLIVASSCPVNCLTFILPHSEASGSEQPLQPQCDYQSCLPQNIVLNRLPCPEATQVQQCMSQSRKTCRGDLSYHTNFAMIKKYVLDNCRSPPKESSSSSMVERQSAISTTLKVRSGDSKSLVQNLTKQHQRVWMTSMNPKTESTASPTPLSPMLPPYMMTEGFDRAHHSVSQSQADYQQYCLTAAYNFSVGKHVMPNVHMKKRTQPSSLLSALPTSSSSYLYKSPSLTSDPYSNRYPRDTTGTFQDATSSVFKPPSVKDPSLTCIIFGDPHLRTFDSRYQTCNSVGARSMIEHPLFDVQVTSTRLQGKLNNIHAMSRS